MIDANINIELQRLQKAKSDIRTAIRSKGVLVPDSDLIDTYPNKIWDIQTGGSSGNFDLAGTGWENEKVFPVNVAKINTITADLDHTRKKFSEWDPSKTYSSHIFENDEKLIYAPKIDTQNVTDMNKTFSGCTNLYAIPSLDTSKATLMREMFYNCSSLVKTPYMDISKVTYMENMFFRCLNLEAVTSFDTSSAIEMSNVFRGCSKLTSLPIYWNTENVISFEYCFAACSKLERIPEMNVGKVITMKSCFGGCSKLKSVELTGGMLPSCDCSTAFMGITTNGVLKLHTGGAITRDSYQKIIDVLPATWTVEEINDL